MAIKVLKHDPNGAPVPGWPDVKGTFDISYVGAVLATRERNYYDDSDFYAVVWDDAAGVIRNVDYATTRGWTYANSAGVDATPDVIAKANAYAATVALKDLKDAAADAARKVAVGKMVKVVKGRKVPKGTEGTVIWLGEGRYYGPVPRYKGGWSTAGATRIGIKTADGTVHWTAASNVEVTDAEDWLPDLADLEARAARVDWSYLLGRSARLMGLAYVA